MRYTLLKIGFAAMLLGAPWVAAVTPEPSRICGPAVRSLGNEGGGAQVGAKVTPRAGTAIYRRKAGAAEIAVYAVDAPTQTHEVDVVLSEGKNLVLEGTGNASGGVTFAHDGHVTTLTASELRQLASTGELGAFMRRVLSGKPTAVKVIPPDAAAVAATVGVLKRHAETYFYEGATAQDLQKLETALPAETMSPDALKQIFAAVDSKHHVGLLADLAKCRRFEVLPRLRDAVGKGKASDRLTVAEALTRLSETEGLKEIENIYNESVAHRNDADKSVPLHWITDDVLMENLGTPGALKLRDKLFGE